MDTKSANPGTDNPYMTNKRHKSRVDLLLEFVKDGLVTDRFQPGERLPTENEIAEELGISRTPVREGFKILDALGLVDIKPGSGTFVKKDLEASVTQLMLFRLYMKSASIDKLVEARRIVDFGCAELATKWRTEEDLEAMQRAIDQLANLAESGTATSEELAKADIAFHRAMIVATHNELIITIANFVLDMIGPWIQQSIENKGPLPAIRFHREWFEIIKAQSTGFDRNTNDVKLVDVGMEHFKNTIHAA